MKNYFVQKDVAIEKRRSQQRKAEEKRRRTKKQLDKMYEENRKVIKDAAANKTYCSASFMTGDNLSNSTAGGKKKKPQYCNLPNCNKPKTHLWNGSKKCRWHGMFTEFKAPRQGQQLIAAIKEHLKQIGEPIMDDSPLKNPPPASSSTHPPSPPPVNVPGKFGACKYASS